MVCLGFEPMAAGDEGRKAKMNPLNKDVPQPYKRTTNIVQPNRSTYCTRLTRERERKKVSCYSTRHSMNALLPCWKQKNWAKNPQELFLGAFLTALPLLLLLPDKCLSLNS